MTSSCASPSPLAAGEGSNLNGSTRAVPFPGGPGERRAGLYQGPQGRFQMRRWLSVPGPPRPPSVPLSPTALCSLSAARLPRSVKGPRGPAPAGAECLWAARRSPPGLGAVQGQQRGFCSGDSAVKQHFSPTKKPGGTIPPHGSKRLRQVSLGVPGVLSQSSSVGLSAQPCPINGLFCRSFFSIKLVRK